MLNLAELMRVLEALKIVQEGLTIAPGNARLTSIRTKLLALLAELDT